MRPRGAAPHAAPKIAGRKSPRGPPDTAASSAQPRRQAPNARRLDVLDNPRLTLDKPADDGFDPYNTGAFNRSTSWDKIGRQRKR